MYDYYYICGLLKVDAEAYARNTLEMHAIAGGDFILSKKTTAVA
jgi:hypothetical protein